MKNLSILMLFIFIGTLLLGCSARQTSEEEVQYKITFIEDEFTAELSNEDSKMLHELLRSRAWRNEATKCEPDIKIESGGALLYYHTECGTFNNSEGHSLSLTKSNKAQLNELIAGYAPDSSADAA